MGLGDAPQDELIVGVGVEDTIFQDRHIGVSALGHDVATMEHGLLYADALGVLGGNYAGQQVQRFDVAVIKTGVFGGVQLDGHIGIVQVVGSDGHPQLAGQILGVDVVAGLNAAGDLPVDEVGGAIHLGQQVGQQLAQFLFRHRDVNIQRLGTGVEAVEVVLHQVHLAIGTDGGIIDAIAKEMYAVVERDHQFFRRADLSIVICKCFHNSFLPCFMIAGVFPSFTAGISPQISAR